LGHHILHAGFDRAATTPHRVPLTNLREWAAAAGWCSGVRSAIIGDNDWWTFAPRLCQAAVDGSVEFYGRLSRPPEI